MTHVWAVFPVLETNNLGSAWRVEVGMALLESCLVEDTRGGTHAVGRRVRLDIW